MDQINLGESRSSGAFVFDPCEWEVLNLDDMCEAEDFGTTNYDQQYYDEGTWDPLDPALVEVGEKDEMDRFARMNVYQYVSRDQAIEDREGKFIKVKWVRINKGTSQNPRVRCRLVGQELGFGVKDDELYAGTPSLVMLKLMLSWYASNWARDSVLNVIDVKSAFLYGKARRALY